MVMELSTGPMELSTKASGTLARWRDRAPIAIPRGTFTEDSLKVIKNLAKESIYILTDPGILVSFKMMTRKVMESKYGLMDPTTKDYLGRD